MNYTRMNCISIVAHPPGKSKHFLSPPQQKTAAAT